MKILELKHSNPKVRTVGQFSCGGSPAYLTSSFGQQNAAEPRNRESEMTRPNLRRTLSNSRSIRSFLEGGDSQDERNTSPARSSRTAFCSISKHVPQTVSSTPALEMVASVQPVTVARRTSEIGVQVDMFHCQECTAHVKRCKQLKHEGTCTDSDSESNLISNGCTTIENDDQLFKPEESPRDYSPPVDHELPSDQDVSAPSSEDEIPRSGNDSRVKATVRRILALSGISFATYAILFFLFVSFLMQTLIFESPIPGITLYLRCVMKQEETEESFSVIQWVLRELFSVQISATPRSLFLKLFNN